MRKHYIFIFLILYSCGPIYQGGFIRLGIDKNIFPSSFEQGFILLTFNLKKTIELDANNIEEQEGFKFFKNEFNNKKGVYVRLFGVRTDTKFILKGFSVLISITKGDLESLGDNDLILQIYSFYGISEAELSGFIFSYENESKKCIKMLKPSLQVFSKDERIFFTEWEECKF